MKVPEDLQLLLQKALVATLAGLLALLLLSALLIGALVMLLQAMTLGLTPWVGEAGAYGIAGFSCLLLLGLIFRGLMPRSRGTAKKPAREARAEDAREAPGEGEKARPGAPLDSFRQVVREHPWDSVAASFALGYAQTQDPRLREILLESGLAYIRSVSAEAGKVPVAPPAAAPGAESGEAEPGNDSQPPAGPAT